MTSKLIPHLERPISQLEEPLSRFPLILGVNPDQWGDDALRAAGPRLIARLMLDPNRGDGVEHPYMLKGAAGADEYLGLLAPRLERLIGFGVRQFIATPNEPDVTREKAPFQAAFCERMVRWFAQRRLAPWIGAFSNGTPDYGLVWFFATACRMAAEAGGGVALHEYSAPNLWNGGGHYTLRYRQFCGELSTAGVHPTRQRVLLGELGIDGICLRDNAAMREAIAREVNTPAAALPKAKRGWMDWRSWPYPSYGELPPGGMSEARCLAQLDWYDREISGDARVVAAAVFTSLPWPTWATFNVGTAMLMAMVAKHATPPPPVAPPPPPPPPALDVAELRQLAASLKSQLDGADDALRAAYITWAILEEMLGAA